MRYSKSVAALIAIVVSVTGGTTAAGASPAAEPALASALRADLSHYLDAQGTKDRFSALSFRLTCPDARPGVAVSVGTTTYGGRTPVSDHALWQIGSNTKAFTAVVTLQLEAERKLSIHDRLGKWLPQYPAWRDVTIQQLLSMTSGIPDYTGQPSWVADIQANPNADSTAAGLIAYVRNLPGLGVLQVAEPVTGIMWAYQGGTFGFRVLHVYVPRTRPGRRDPARPRRG